MNVKRLGFLTGAVVAGFGVWAFYALTDVTDDDRLTVVLRDHCLPFVTAGATPFDALGRSPGVYDDVSMRDDLTNGGVRILYDNRFIAQWGVVSSGDASLRMCEVNPSYGESTIAAFEVQENGFIDRYSKLLGGLIPDAGAITSGPIILGWYGSDRAPDEGLRVVMTVSPGLVSGVLLVDDVDGR